MDQEFGRDEHGKRDEESDVHLDVTNDQIAENEVAFVVVSDAREIPLPLGRRVNLNGERFRIGEIDRISDAHSLQSLGTLPLDGPGVAFRPKHVLRGEVVATYTEALGRC
jgi:hypothetical protein